MYLNQSCSAIVVFVLLVGETQFVRKVMRPVRREIPELISSELIFSHFYRTRALSTFLSRVLKRFTASVNKRAYIISRESLYVKQR